MLQQLTHRRLGQHVFALRARTDDDVDVFPIPLVNVAGVVVGVEEPVLQHQLVTRLIEPRSRQLVDERVHERLRKADILAGDGAAHRPLEFPVPGGGVLTGEIEIQHIAEGQLRPGQGHDGQRLRREPFDELQQSAVGRRILGFSNLDRSTGRPRKAAEIDGFRAEQTRARMGEVSRASSMPFRGLRRGSPRPQDRQRAGNAGFHLSPGWGARFPATGRTRSPAWVLPGR